MIRRQVLMGGPHGLELSADIRPVIGRAMKQLNLDSDRWAWLHAFSSALCQRHQLVGAIGQGVGHHRSK